MSDEERNFSLFELTTAIVLGISATATALVSHENGLWGGKSIEAYGEAATMTSKASNLDNAAVVESSQDSNVEIEAKKLIREAARAKGDAEKEASLNMASYLLTDFLSDPAYEGFELPKEYREGEKEDEYLSEEVLQRFARTESLGQTYTDALFSEAEKLFDDADKTFGQGREANDIGDKFSFAAVIYAISLFFGGIASVFKSSVRWVILGVAGVLLVAGTGYAATLTWLPIL